MVYSYEDLEVYKTSYELALKLHRITQKYPEYERYEMGSQLRRASLSVPLNIAEGYGKRDSGEEFKRYLHISQGSANEVKVLIEFSRDLGYINQDESERLIESYKILGKRKNTLIKNWK